MKPDVRDRLVLPLLVPLGLLAAVAVTAVAFGMILFFNPITVSLTIAIVVAGSILAAFGLASAARADELTRAKRAVIVLAGVAPLLIGALTATDILPVDAVKVAHGECEFCIPEDAVEVVAEGIAFEQGTIELPAAEEVSILFINRDQGIPHNVYIFALSQGQPVKTDPVFAGETFNGLAQRVYTFEAPEEPGEFYFECTVHPNEMFGTAVFE